MPRPRCFTVLDRFPQRAMRMEASTPGHPSPVSLQQGDPVHGELVALAAAQVRGALGKEVELDLQAVDRCGHWALVHARLRDPGGGPLSLHDTAFAEAAAAGGVSDLAMLLFRNPAGADGEDWEIVDRAILPTDVAWLGWPQQHGVPSQLLGIGG